MNSLADLSMPPGEFLQLEYLTPNGASLYEFSLRSGMSLDEVHEFINGDLRISPKLAKFLGEYTGDGEEFWKAVQEDFDEMVLTQIPS